MPVCSASLANGQPCTKRSKHVHEGRQFCGIHRRFQLPRLPAPVQRPPAAVQPPPVVVQRPPAAVQPPPAAVQPNFVAAQPLPLVLQAAPRQPVAEQNLHLELERVQGALAVLRREQARLRRLQRAAALERARRVVVHMPPQILARDPVGEVDLRAFGQDTQSVHRSAIQSSTEAGLGVILARPLGQGQNTMPEITTAFNAVKFINRARVLQELKNDIGARNLVAFNHTFKVVLDHVWATIRTHEHKGELVRRLFQELYGGIGMCSNGKMCRLLCVLQGFDDQVVAVVSRDAFQSKFATLAKLPMAQRAAAAQTVFNDYKIPEAERDAWLEPLLEA